MNEPLIPLSELQTADKAALPEVETSELEHVNGGGYSVFGAHVLFLNPQPLPPSHPDE
jgi:hypothetical protein